MFYDTPSLTVQIVIKDGQHTHTVKFCRIYQSRRKSVFVFPEFIFGLDLPKLNKSKQEQEAAGHLPLAC